MTTTHTHATTPATEGVPSERRSRWPLVASGAGLLGLAATMILDGRGNTPEKVVLDTALFESLNPVVYRASMVLGYLAVAMLLLTAAQWRRRVEPRLPGSTAAHLVPLGLVASAAGLTYGYGWKGALGNYMPGGFEDGLYDIDGLAVYYMLADFGAWIGWLGVIVVAAAVAWMGLRERTVSRWIAVVSLVPVVQTTAMVAGLGVAGVPALLGPLYLVVLGVGLAFGKSAISR